MSTNYEYDDTYPEFDFDEDGVVDIGDLSIGPDLILKYLAGDFDEDTNDNQITAQLKASCKKAVQKHVRGRNSGAITIADVAAILDLASFKKNIEPDSVRIGDYIVFNKSDMGDKKYEIAFGEREFQDILPGVPYIIYDRVTVREKEQV